MDKKPNLQSSSSILNLDGLKSDLVAANRILSHHGVVDAFGHVSVRHPIHRDRFLMARRLAPALISLRDICEFGPDGELIGDEQTSLFLERYIHSEIYRARLDVNAIVHSHSMNIIAVGIVNGMRLRPVCHTCGFLKDGVPLFEIRDVAGDATNLLITSRQLGKALAEKLGDANIVLMRGHGSTVIGSTVGQAVFRAVYSETNARIQAQASSLGEVTFLSSAETNAVEDGSPLLVERTWELWKKQVVID